MATNKELQQQLEELSGVVERLATHLEVLALAVRKPGSVPQADLDDAVTGIGELRALAESHKRAP